MKGWRGVGRVLHAGPPKFGLAVWLSGAEMVARSEEDRRAATRLTAIADALDGPSRAGAARLAVMARQALGDAVIRYNAEGPSGLHDRPRPGRPETPTLGRCAAPTRSATG
jgi:hypothetical protein